MQKLLIYAAIILHLVVGVAAAQPAATSGNQSLSLDQQSKISEIIADQTPQPLTNVTFSVAPLSTDYPWKPRVWPLSYTATVISPLKN